MNLHPSCEAGARPEYPRNIPPSTARDMLLDIHAEPESERYLLTRRWTGYWPTTPMPLSSAPL